MRQRHHLRQMPGSQGRKPTVSTAGHPMLHRRPSVPRDNRELPRNAGC